MKRFLVICLVMLSSLVNAQFRGEDNKPTNIMGSIVNDSPSSLLLGFINQDNLQINHSLNMSYTTFGNQGIALGVYTGSLKYKFNDDLNLQVDASIVNSPYSSFGDNYANQINGVYISRAQLNYRPADDVFISVQFSQVPAGSYQPYYRTSPFHRTGWEYDSPFEN